MLGFMLPTWFLSMWISNTATTAMMIPIVAAVLEEMRGGQKADNRLSYSGKAIYFIHLRLNKRR
jgi:sodium-dependent dicarboxylate transporter 2/3/5